MMISDALNLFMSVPAHTIPLQQKEPLEDVESISAAMTGAAITPAKGEVISDEESVEPKWKTELTKTSMRFHRMGAWVAVIFNILFSVTDYVNSPGFWKEFLLIRVLVSSITAAGVLLERPLRLRTEVVIFIPFLLICFQNAYMWSNMDVTLLQKHTLAYIAIFIGAGMLVVWEMKYTVSIVTLSVIANLVCFYAFSSLNFDEVMAAGGVLTLSVAIFSILLIQTRYRLTKKEIVARLALEESMVELSDQKVIIEEKSQSITESIEYAKTIQEAMMPSMAKMQEILPECAVFYRPRDIVSGDFYWCGQVEGVTVIAAVDCTGHGVPGALLSMIGTTILNRIVTSEKMTTPHVILDALRAGVIRLLGQDSDNVKNDSMDMALCTIHHEKGVLEYAGAYNPLYLVHKGALMETKADKMPIGIHPGAEEESFTTHTIDIERGDTIYLFSDGFPDQFGGPKNKKYSSRRMKNFLTTISSLPMTDQQHYIANEFDRWKGDKEQIDDVLMIGLRID